MSSSPRRSHGSFTPMRWSSTRRRRAAVTASRGSARRDPPFPPDADSSGRPTRVSDRFAAGGMSLILAVTAMVAPGCGMRAGALAYALGVGSQHKVKAEYALSPGPILILVDDYADRLFWPETGDLLATAVADELLTHKATKKVISNDTLRKLRQVHQDFDQYSCRRVGETVGADQVLWLEVTEFFASETVEDTTVAARLGVTVKVINPKGTKQKRTVRLWPTEQEGRSARAELSSNDISRAGTRPAIVRALTSQLAVQIARLFYDHTLGDLVDQ
jgi:hypothetical protein